MLHCDFAFWGFGSSTSHYTNKTLTKYYNWIVCNILYSGLNSGWHIYDSMPVAGNMHIVKTFKVFYTHKASTLLNKCCIIVRVIMFETPPRPAQYLASNVGGWWQELSLFITAHILFVAVSLVNVCKYLLIGRVRTMEITAFDRLSGRLAALFHNVQFE